MGYDNEKTIKVIAILLTFATGILLIFRLSKTEITSKLDQNLPKTSQAVYQEAKQELPSLSADKENVVDLKINPLADMNGWSRERVFNLRKSYVADSIFAPKGYDPSKSPVLGQIESGKPWLGIDAEPDGTAAKNITAGLSEETRFLNNPNILVGLILWPVYGRVEDGNKLANSTIPEKLTYSKNDNTVEVTYNLSNLYNVAVGYKWFEVGEQKFQLDGINARDLGYPYAYVSELSNIKFVEQSNISNTVIEFLDFLHVGGSCGVKGGCNNGSPRQDYLVFSLQNPPKYVETRIVVKLWKERPLTTMIKEDTKLIMIFK